MNTVKDQWEHLLASAEGETDEMVDSIMKLGFYCGAMAILTMARDTAEMVQGNDEIADQLIDGWVCECLDELGRNPLTGEMYEAHLNG